MPGGCHSPRLERRTSGARAVAAWIAQARSQATPPGRVGDPRRGPLQRRRRDPAAESPARCRAAAAGPRASRSGARIASVRRASSGRSRTPSASARHGRSACRRPQGDQRRADGDRPGPRDRRRPAPGPGPARRRGHGAKGHVGGVESTRAFTTGRHGAPRIRAACSTASSQDPVERRRPSPRRRRRPAPARRSMTTQTKVSIGVRRGRPRTSSRAARRRARGRDGSGRTPGGPSVADSRSMGERGKGLHRRGDRSHPFAARGRPRVAQRCATPAARRMCRPVGIKIERRRAAP